MYAARIRARRRETRSGKDITGLSRMTRKTRPQTGIIRRVRPLRMRVHVRVRVPVRKQVRFIYRVRIGEILRWRREILSARCNYFLMDIDLCYNACRWSRMNDERKKCDVRIYKVKTCAILAHALTARPGHPCS